MRVSCSGAVGDHRDRLGRGVRGIVDDLHVEHRGEAAESLRADAERIDLVVQLDAQLLDPVPRPARLELRHVDGLHQRLLRHQHRLLGGTADADAEHARRAPTGAHGRHGLHHPLDDGVARVEHGELGLVLGAATLGSELHLDVVAGDDLAVDHSRRVVAGVLPREGGVGDDRGAENVLREKVGASHAFVDHLLHREGGVPPDVHPDLEEDHDDAGVLADGAVTLGTHARVGEDLRDRVLGGGALLLLVCVTQCTDVVEWVEVRDVLEGVGDGLDQVRLLDRGHAWKTTTGWGFGTQEAQGAQGTATARALWGPQPLRLQHPDDQESCSRPLCPLCLYGERRCGSAQRRTHSQECVRRQTRRSSRQLRFAENCRSSPGKSSPSCTASLKSLPLAEVWSA